mgnify:CR=1 FL=1
MIKKQQSLWLAGFTGVSTACIMSFLISNVSPIDRPFMSQPDTLLAANIDADQMVTLNELRQMLDSHFARLDTDKDGMINPDEYAGRHINLFLTIDRNSNQKLSPTEIRLHNMRGHNMRRDRVTQSLLYMSTYEQ